MHIFEQEQMTPAPGTRVPKLGSHGLYECSTPLFTDVYRQGHLQPRLGRRPSARAHMSICISVFSLASSVHGYFSTIQPSYVQTPR